MRLRLVILASAGLAGCAMNRQSDANRVGPTARACVIEDYDRKWIDRALGVWGQVTLPALKLEPAPMPLLIFFDRACEYRVVSISDSALRVSAAFDSRAYDQVIALPNGARFSPEPLALTSQAQTDSSPFVTMALAPIWRENPRWISERDWPLFLRRSLVHELTHTRQLPVMGRHLNDVRAELHLGSIDDDIVQEHWGRSDAFRASVKRETYLLFAAATTRDSAERRAFARDAIHLIQARRDIFFAGELAPWATLEQIFLDMEGVAQWAAFETVRRETRGSARYAMKSVRDASYWSQEEGLALYLVLDALVPDWQKRMFSAAPPTSLALLQAALAVPVGATIGQR